MTKDELRYTIALNQLYRNRLYKEHLLLDRYHSVMDAWNSLDEIGKNEALQFADTEMAFIEKHRIDTYFYQDDNYPRRLQSCPDCPILLYGKGNIRLNEDKMVSIVGTRSASENGKEWTRRFVLDLAQAIPNLTIISGLAFGIDVAAHRAALEAHIPTVVVLGHGLDRIYPALHRPVAIETLSQGGLITEYPSGTEPNKINFVARDRIIAGLADAVIVVESKERGGSLITAKMASDYSRPVFAVPGRATDIGSAGCNELIRKQKAQLITSAQDLIQAMNWESSIPVVQTQIETFIADLDDTSRAILHAIRSAEEGIHINALVMDLQLSYSQVSTALTMLELQDFIKSLPGGIYRAVR